MKMTAIGDLLRCALAWASSRRSMNRDRKSTRLNSSHSQISYAAFCLNKKHTVDHFHSVVNISGIPFAIAGFTQALLEHAMPQLRHNITQSHANITPTTLSAYYESILI